MINLESPDKPKVNLQFPNLHSALLKNQKDLDDDDARRGVIVVDKHAIVLNKNFCIVVDLFEYFTVDGGITDSGEVEVLKNILFYMNGKTFTSEYWKELVKGANMRMQEGLLYIETPKYAKDLHYKDMEVNLYEPMQRLIAANDNNDGMVSAISLPIDALIAIQSTLKELKADHIILEFDRTDKPVKFTFKNRKFVFGFIVPHYESLEEGFRFEYLQNFAKNETVKFLLEDYAPAPVPQAPTIPDREQEILDSRPASLFDKNGE